MKMHEYFLHDLFELNNGNKFDKNKMSHTHPSINFISRTGNNNGISDVVDRVIGTDPYPKGCLTLAFGGSIGSCFLQDAPFYTGQNVGVIKFATEIPTEAKLYIKTVLEKVCKNRFVAFGDEINKHFKTDLSILLPVIENSDSSHTYTADDIDWQYMCDRIEELEADRIEELEAYLAVTGLDDYELTDDDKEVLSLSLGNQHLRRIDVMKMLLKMR